MKAKLKKLIAQVEWERLNALQDYETLKICNPTQAASKFGQYELTWRFIDYISFTFKEELSNDT